MKEGGFRYGAARFFEPDDCLVDARLQQMRPANRPIPKGDDGIARAEADGPLHERDYFLYRAGEELAKAETGKWHRPVAVGRESRFVFGNGLLASALRTQHLAFHPTRKPVARRCGQRLVD